MHGRDATVAVIIGLDPVILTSPGTRPDCRQNL